MSGALHPTHHLLHELLLVAHLLLDPLVTHLGGLMIEPLGELDCLFCTVSFEPDLHLALIFSKFCLNNVVVVAMWAIFVSFLVLAERKKKK